MIFDYKRINAWLFLAWGPSPWHSVTQGKYINQLVGHKERRRIIMQGNVFKVLHSWRPTVVNVHIIQSAVCKENPNCARCQNVKAFGCAIYNLISFVTEPEGLQKNVISLVAIVFVTKITADIDWWQHMNVILVWYQTKVNAMICINCLYDFCS